MGDSKDNCEEGETTLTEQDVYIIASVCGVIIVTLLIILVIFICRRRRNQAKYEENKTATELRAQPVNGVSSPNKKPQVYENQGMSYLPGVDLDDPVPPSSTNVYSLSYPDSNSNNTNHNFSTSYGPLDLKLNHGNGHLANGHVTGNGSIPHGGHDTSYDSQIDKRVFENEMNRRNEYSTRVDYNNRQGGDLHFHGMPNTKPKDQYLDLEEKKDGSLPSNPESGYSTPDPAKPKKLQFFKLKHREPNALLYSDYSRYAHDPPGHTCGLPCCNENLRLELQGQSQRRIPGCIPAPVKYSAPNFTLRTKRNLIKGRPTFANKFLSLQPGNFQSSKQRPVLPDFYDDSLVGSCYLSHVKNKPKVNEWDHFYPKEIALPELLEDGDQMVLVNHDGADTSDDLDENEIGVVEIHNDIRGYPRPLQVPVLSKCPQPKAPEPTQAILESPTDEDYASGSASDKYTDYELSDSDYNTSSDHYYDVIHPLPLPKPLQCQKPKSCLKKTHRRKLSIPEKFSTLPKHFLSGKTKNFQSNSVAPYLPPVQNLFHTPVSHSNSQAEVWTVPVPYDDPEQIYEDIVLEPEVPLSEVQPIVNKATERVNRQLNNSVVNSPLKKRSSSIDTHKIPWAATVRGDRSSRKRVSFALDADVRRNVSRTVSMTNNMYSTQDRHNTVNPFNSLMSIKNNPNTSDNDSNEVCTYPNHLNQNGSNPNPCDIPISALTLNQSESVPNSNICQLDIENESGFKTNIHKFESEGLQRDNQRYLDQGLSSLIKNPVTLIL
ncbi:hypothetical protein LOTGIDRAFT_158102 [Lottia gigantea]|uniref:Uncharacterized protein n=1 Tax=Lottia gigantea TaxID=225164 RepID=V4B128_LOTGI|nr:hypothetical protein LOTGIDRAFT_158102 [Lottia gigantea]ESO99941.1 hypothetical protein LOTGIDRAFT_158102 [Lottia gigantea]